MRLRFVGCIWFCCGCSDPDASQAGDGATETAVSSNGGSEGGGVDAEAIKGMADGYAAFEQINAEAGPSQHGNASTVNWWVPTEHAATFRMVDPDAPAEFAFPEGTLIVKEHLDSDDAPDGYTMMWKGPERTNAEADDWWFARVAGNGELAENGAVGLCMNCHAAVEQSDWVYGVPLDNRR